MTREEGQAAARTVIEGFGRRIFIRNTSQDHQPGWAVRALPYVAALAKLEQFADEPLE